MGQVCGRTAGKGSARRVPRRRWIVASEHVLKLKEPATRLWYAQQTIANGWSLCKSRKRTVAEYALRDLGKPVGVARYVTKLVASLPAELQGNLPTIEQLEAELAKAKEMGDQG